MHRGGRGGVVGISPPGRRLVTTFRAAGPARESEEVPKEATMIEVRDLTKRYNGTPAVDALSFDVRPGTVTGFLGPNGSGKSTT